MDDGGDKERFGYTTVLSTAGFFFTKNRSFSTLWDMAKVPTHFLDQHGTICSSTCGLFLCHYPQHVPILRHYTVYNPYVANSARVIPKPLTDPHPDDIPRVLIAYAKEGRIFINIVFALPTSDDSSMYTIEVYSSANDKWTSSGPHVLGRIREETGVCAGTAACWLVEDSPTCVRYDVLTDKVTTSTLPDKYVEKFGKPDIGLRSQLGEARYELCFVAATEEWRAVYSLSGDTNEWTCRKEVVKGDKRGLPTLSRFQGYKLQVPFWFDADGKLDIWDSSWNDHLSCERTKTLQGPPREVGTDILPLLHTPTNPSKL